MRIKCLIYNLVRTLNKTWNKSFDEKLVEDLTDRVLKLEKRQRDLEESLQKGYGVKNIVIERMHADKVEFNIEAIDVDELSGMLSIGLNYGGKLVKIQPQETVNTGEKCRNADDSAGSEEDLIPKPKITMFFETEPNTDG